LLVLGFTGYELRSAIAVRWCWLSTPDARRRHLGLRLVRVAGLELASGADVALLIDALRCSNLLRRSILCQGAYPVCIHCEWQAQATRGSKAVRDLCGKLTPRRADATRPGTSEPLARGAR